MGLATAMPGREPARSNPTFAGLRRDLAAAAAQAQSRKRLFVGTTPTDGLRSVVTPP
jgi:hypothetical protein